MLKKIRFSDFRVLRSTSIQLGAFNLLIGGNGSGKSTVIDALSVFGRRQVIPAQPGQPVADPSLQIPGVRFYWDEHSIGSVCEIHWGNGITCSLPDEQTMRDKISSFLSHIYCFQWQTAAIVASANKPFADESAAERGEPGLSGEYFAASLWLLQQQDPVSYTRWQQDLYRWFPEYAEIELTRPAEDVYEIHFLLRNRQTRIPLHSLSEGTLYTMATLLISHFPRQARFICIEEPDRGISPRLFGELRDALYRLSFPEQYELQREPIQVLATTHSPYLLDLFADCPEQVSISTKNADGYVTIEHLSDDSALLQQLGDASLGEVWYSGLLGNGS